MEWIDWLIVLGLNGSIIAYGFYLARGSQSSVDWFLGGRSLPWWIVGISMYATAIDASDLVADSGGTYTLGLTYFVTNWVGTVVGWVLAVFFLFMPMYRSGMYTNAEYLESRFGVSSRVLCALVQVQYRTLVLAIPADEASAKVRSGPPIDDDEDYALDIWAGVIPLRTVAAPPLTDPRATQSVPKGVEARCADLGARA